MRDRCIRWRSERLLYRQWRKLKREETRAGIAGHEFRARHIREVCDRIEDDLINGRMINWPPQK